jgi:hypothetical protein
VSLVRLIVGNGDEWRVSLEHGGEKGVVFHANERLGGGLGIT